MFRFRHQSTPKGTFAEPRRAVCRLCLFVPRLVRGVRRHSVVFDGRSPGKSLITPESDVVPQATGPVIASKCDPQFMQSTYTSPTGFSPTQSKAEALKIAENELLALLLTLQKRREHQFPNCLGQPDSGQWIETGILEIEGYLQRRMRQLCLALDERKRSLDMSTGSSQIR